MISPGMQSCEHSLNTLRYADRVKELGAENPETKNGDEYGDEEEEDDEENGEEDDLALLHNSNVSLIKSLKNLILISNFLIKIFKGCRTAGRLVHIPRGHFSSARDGRRNFGHSQTVYGRPWPVDGHSPSTVQDDM